MGHSRQGNAHGHGRAEHEAKNEKDIKAASEKTAGVALSHNRDAGGADAEERFLADVEEIGDGERGDKVRTPGIGPPVHEKIGEGPVIRVHAHGLGVLRRAHDVIERLRDGPEHDGASDSGAENHGRPAEDAELGFFILPAEFDVPPAAQGKIKAHADKDNRYPKIQRAKVESQRVIKSLEELFRALRGNNCRDADEQNNDNCRNEYLPFRSEIVVLDRLGCL